jgi:hypothetical protein
MWPWFPTTVVTEKLSSIGFQNKPPSLVNLVKRKITMNGIAGKFVQKFGTCVIIVSLFSGCATHTPSAVAINPEELKWFNPDCRQAGEQMAWLQSLRRSADDQLFSVRGWLGEGQRVNWLINSHIRYLRDYC